MTKRRLRNAGRRPKAFLGMSESAAIMAAAGINAAAQASAAIMGANATKQAAKAQANSAINAARQQSQAIKDQTLKNKEYQETAQTFIKEQNEENRQIQKDIQMQLQMMQGQQNVNDRLEAARLAVKKGGKTKNRNIQQILLRGGNMPFKITDGGGVLPIGSTPEGYDIYELYGNDHEHYHKTKGGKYKSGVGIRFADGNIIEGEGNQNTGRGELMIVTPDDAYFVSKHSINGINPAELVKQGIHPLEAYSIQEQQKAIKGINDEGNMAKCGRKLMMGGTPDIYDYNNMLSPHLDTDISSAAVGGAIFSKPQLKYGGRSRTCLAKGGRVKAKNGNGLWYEYMNRPSTRSIYTPNPNAPVGSWDWAMLNYTPNASNLVSQTTLAGKYNNPNAAKLDMSKIKMPKEISSPSSKGSWLSRNADLVGAGITGLANIAGGLIGDAANRSAAKTLANAYGTSSKMLAEAYNNLKTIDLSNIRREDYAAAHAMPALQAPVSFANTGRSIIGRALQRNLANAARYSGSGAAAQSRMANAEINAIDEINKIESADQQQMQAIRQANAERISAAAMKNAELDTDANQEFGDAYLEGLKYNNNIENTRILGAAQSLAEGTTKGANALSVAQTSNGTLWSNILATTGSNAGSTLSAMAKRRADLNNVLLGADTDGYVTYWAMNGTPAQKSAIRQKYINALASGNISDDNKKIYERYITLLS